MPELIHVNVDKEIDTGNEDATGRWSDCGALQ
jgi:hypothetical protein